jgi:hypothetical protein
MGAIPSIQPTKIDQTVATSVLRAGPRRPWYLKYRLGFPKSQDPLAACGGFVREVRGKMRITAISG